MIERNIHISSINRVKVGKKAEDFVIQFNPILKLENNMKHDLAVDRLSMTYVWHNINPEYKNVSNTVIHGKQFILSMGRIHTVI